MKDKWNCFGSYWWFLGKVFVQNEEVKSCTVDPESRKCRIATRREWLTFCFFFWGQNKRLGLIDILYQSFGVTTVHFNFHARRVFTSRRSKILFHPSFLQLCNIEQFQSKLKNIETNALFSGNIFCIGIFKIFIQLQYFWFTFYYHCLFLLETYVCSMAWNHFEIISNAESIWICDV